MGVFRKKPVEIEAYRWMANDDIDKESLGNDHMAEWLGAAYVVIRNDRLTIKTLEGLITARPGDWVVRGVQGEFYPVKPDIFAATYEAVYPLYSLSQSGEIERVE